MSPVAEYLCFLRQAILMQTFSARQYSLIINIFSLLMHNICIFKDKNTNNTIKIL